MCFATPNLHILFGYGGDSMTAIKNWLFGIIAVCAVLAVAYSVVPKGKFRTILRCGGGIILLLALLQPVLDADWSEIKHSFSDWKWELGGENQVILDQEKAELASIIEAKTAAYIEEKAASLGVVCHVQVKCVERDGVPFPHEIVMDNAYFDELSKQIAADLDIKKENQHWKEGAE